MEEMEESRPWYAAGLYRRVQERRHWRPERAPRKPWRQRLRERGLHWNLEFVVGVFVAVVAVSLATVALAGHGSASASGAAGRAATQSGPSPTPNCIAAPIAGSARRVCAATP
jgi:hypothetical protein